MTYARARAELHRLTVRAIRPGLTRTRRLLTALKHPDRDCPAVQITGTNGKGSVAALLSAALTAAGYRTGLYTSPHLEHERERIRIGGTELPTRAFTRACERLLPGLRALKRAGDPATLFEAWTVLAAEAFRGAEADIAVVEVGMGGRLDATSAWKRIILSVLTHVSLEHTRELGPDLESICREKAAIARPGVPLLSGEADPRLRSLIRTQARHKGCPVYFAGALRDTARAAAWSRTANGIRVDAVLGADRVDGLEAGLRGEHQAANVVLAALGVQQLNRQGFVIPESALRSGFRSVSWPGRLEKAARQPKIFLDGAHNPAAARAVAREMLATAGRVEMVAGVMADKDVEQITRNLGAAARRVWALTPPEKRGLPASGLAARFRAAGVPAEPRRSWEAALREAIQAAGRRGTVLVVGSLYNIAPARKALKKILGSGRKPRGLDG